MWRYWSIVLTSIALASCTGGSGIYSAAPNPHETTFAVIEAGLESMMGSNAEVAFARLGYPTDSHRVAEDAVYTWFRSSTKTYHLPQTNYGTGYVNGEPMRFSFTSYDAISQQWHCTVSIVRPDGVIASWDFRGNAGGCETYAQAFR